MKNKMYAVGPEDDDGWEAVQATSDREAKKLFLESNPQSRYGIMAMRIEEWEALDREPNGADWINAGFYYTCDYCNEPSSLDDDLPAKIVDGDVVCGYCARI